MGNRSDGCEEQQTSMERTSQPAVHDGAFMAKTEIKIATVDLGSLWGQINLSITNRKHRASTESSLPQMIGLLENVID